jgi:uncharacterized protein YndB with AHSA1/START domain
MPIESVKKQIVVEATPERAFRIFADQARWWPSEHKLFTEELKAVVLEPRVGGRWYQTGVNGASCNIGRVLVWDPPKRMVLAWQLTSEFKFDTNFMTEVEVRFAPAGPGKTRVELEHRDLDRYGEGARALRESLDSKGGWELSLDHFSRAVASAPVEA